MLWLLSLAVALAVAAQDERRDELYRDAHDAYVRSLKDASDHCSSRCR